MNERYITVKAFASFASVTCQALYSAMKGRLKPYVKVINGKKMLDSRALQDVYGISYEGQKPDTETSKPLQNFASFSSQLEQGLQSDYIAFLKSQIAEKDELIKSQQTTIQSLTERLKEGNYLVSKSVDLIEDGQPDELQPETEIIVEAVEPIREEKEEPKEPDFWSMKKPSGWLSMLLDEANKKK